MVDTKLSALPSAATLALTDKAVIVKNPGGAIEDEVALLSVLRDTLRSFAANKVTSTTAAGTVTLTDASNDVQIIDPGGASRDVTLPAVAATNHAMMIFNAADADEVLTVKNVGGTIIGKVFRDEARTFISSGSAWNCQQLKRQIASIPAGAFSPYTDTGPTFSKLTLSTAVVRKDTLDFDATTTEYASLDLQLPDWWNAGTVRAKFHWTHPATTTNFGVTWNIAGRSYANDDAQDQASGTPQLIVDTGGTTNDEYISDWTPAVTLGGTPAGGQLVTIKIYRDPVHASDTMAVDARLLSVTLEFTSY